MAYLTCAIGNGDLRSELWVHLWHYNAMEETLNLQHPIILVHGLGALGKVGPIEYFHKIPKWLSKHGNRVHVVNLALWQSIDHCAEELNKRMLTLYPGEKVNLIGHSMGGLNARLFTSRFDRGERVASVTTIGTPNHGSAIADHFLELFLGDVLDKTEHLAHKFNLSHQGLKQISKKYFDEYFHLEIQDVPGVAYFSATSVIKSPAILNSLPGFWITHPILKHYEGENDGFVSEESARWGTHICTYQGGDHYAQIGQIMGHTRFPYLKFFGEIVARLRGEGL